MPGKTDGVWHAQHHSEGKAGYRLIIVISRNFFVSHESLTRISYLVVQISKNYLRLAQGKLRAEIRHSLRCLYGRTQRPVRFSHNTTGVGVLIEVYYPTMALL
jgi:hypothetical protein